jgi:hypothetical protein
MEQVKRLRPALSVLRAVVGPVLVIAAFYYVIRNLLTGYESLIAMGFAVQYPWLILGAGIMMLCAFLGGWEWNLLLSALGHDLLLTKGLRIHLTANIAKYIPGYAWQVLGKVYLARKDNISTAVASLSIALEFFFVVLTGGLVVGLFLPSTPLLLLSPASRKMWQSLSALGVLGFFIILPPLSRWIVRRLPGTDLWGIGLKEIDLTRIAFVVVAMFFTWLLLGVGFCFLVGSVHPIKPVDVPIYVSALAISLISSLLAIFVPAGWGIREAILTYLLSYAMPPVLSSVVALLARVALIAADSLAFVLIMGLRLSRTTAGSQE